MEPLDPLRVEYVGLGPCPAPRELPRLHQLDLESLRLQELEEGDPVDAGGLHGDGLDAAGLQPRGDRLEVGGIAAELADRLGVAVGRDADHVHIGMDVDAGGVGVDDLKRGRRGGDREADRAVGRPGRRLRLLRLPRSLRLLRFPRLLGLIVGNDHGSLRLGRTRCVTTRRRAPRGVAGTLRVSPTGSIPWRVAPAWQVTNDKVEPPRARLRCGQDAPEEKRPLTRDAGDQGKGAPRSEPEGNEQQFTGRQGAAAGGSGASLAPSGL